MFAAGPQASIAFAPAPLGLPAEVLEGVGWAFQSALEMPTHVGGIALGPGPFHQSSTGRGVAGFGEGTLPASLPTAILRGDEPQALHQLSGVLAAREVAKLCHRGDGHGARHAAPGLQRLNDRVHTPGGHGLVACLCQTLQPFRVFVDRAAICWKDHGLSWGGTDDCAEPPEVGRAPGGPAGLPHIVPPQKGFQPKFGGLEVTDGIFTCAAQVADGFIFNCGDIDGGEVP
jgi:hypothetical protein